MSLPEGSGDIDCDAALKLFWESGLDDYDFLAKNAMLSEISTIVSQRPILDERREQTVKARQNLPTGAYFLQQQRQSFRQFMDDCRGVDPEDQSPGAETDETPPPSAEPDSITLACTTAWLEKLRIEAGNWWQTLAQQIPPGILLLFLLATLGGLYRYTLRLAGFHASRADLLELLSMEHDGDDHPFKTLDKETFSRITDALAADKVDFGKGNMPTDQAVSVAQAILNRR